MVIGSGWIHFTQTLEHNVVRRSFFFCQWFDGLAGGHADGDVTDDEDCEDFEVEPDFHVGADLLVSTPGLEKAYCRESANRQNCFSNPFAGFSFAGSTGLGPDRRIGAGAGRITIPGWLSSDELLSVDRPLKGGASNSSRRVVNCELLNVV